MGKHKRSANGRSARVSFDAYPIFYILHSNPFLQSQEQISNLLSSQDNVESLSNIGKESENKTVSVAHSSSAVEDTSLSSRSENTSPSQWRRKYIKKICLRTNQGPASAADSVLEKFLDSSKTQEPKLDPIHNFFMSMEESFKAFLPDIQVEAEEKIFQIITAAKRSLLQ
jgi:hypothetical protein